MKDKDIIKRLLTTEKTTQRQQEENKYTFSVDKRANKPQIKKAIEQVFKVKVLKIRTANMRGKKRRVRWQEGKRPDWKKAVVSLKSGDRIEVEA